MKPEDIQVTDWLRILLGEVPGIFLLEIVIRVAFIYLVLMVSMRIMGKRMASMLSRTEMAALVSLAAANGVALMDPSRGILPIAIIAFVVVGIQRLISWRSTQDASFEETVMDDMDILVIDGTLQLDIMERTRITRDRLFAQFRHEDIFNLGKVQRTYMEANGSFTIMKFAEDRPGLPLIPDIDPDFLKEQKVAPDTFACKGCGLLVKSQRPPQHDCTNCGANDWKEAVIS
ncbi:YetF domain-containing protein [Rufibacter sp. XAAS-G3-1]|uniref:YetF domain-containing protein n=1 Tax=Rufibacter sp. XAAS-G3-1 TaxID=2729134 RepID=UPI0015E78A43|nr:YetF domain-containing protein [Rufibacter sp. XAAS-G3-1]